eukprot:TRINITY_DN501_c0_g1_i1.p1 TRINITY_DN501_c0_g1~~TRINITY_DN501_c0_g1_i1.p1  ORF type:complete len:148 (-),score=54.22 TRINITY_DN501_c0_g1_i1:138-581(-)
MNNLNQQELQELKSVFFYFTNKQNELTAEHLKGAFRTLAMPINEKEIEQMMKEAGSTGKINFTEFATMMGNKMGSMDNPKSVLEALECFDTEGTGVYTRDQFTNILTGGSSKFKPQDVTNIMKEVGTDKEGNMDYRKLHEKMYDKNL